MPCFCQPPLQASPASAATSAATSSSATAASAAPSAVAAKTTTLHQLAGRYRYSQPQAQHRLEINSVQWQPATTASTTTPTNTPSSASRLRLQATLGGQTPMPLHLQANATCPCLPHLLWLPAAPVPHPHQQPHPAPLSKPCASACKPQARWRNPKAACALQAASKRKHKKTPQHKPPSATASHPAPLAATTPHPSQPAMAKLKPARLLARASAHPAWQRAELPISPATLAQQHSQPSKPSAIAPAVTGQFAALGAGHWPWRYKPTTHKQALGIKTCSPCTACKPGRSTTRTHHASPCTGSPAPAPPVTSPPMPNKPQHGWQASINAHALAPADFYSPLASNSPNNKTNDKISGTFEELQSAPLPKPSADNAPLNLALSLQTERPSQPNSHTNQAARPMAAAHPYPAQHLRKNARCHPARQRQLPNTPKPRKPTCNSPPLAHRHNSKAKSPPPADRATAHQRQRHTKNPALACPIHHRARPAPIPSRRHLTLNAHWRGGWQAQGSTLQLNANLDAPPSPCKPSRWRHLLPKMQTAAPQPQAPPHRPQPSPPSATPALPCKATMTKLRLNAQTRAQQTTALQLALKAKRAYCPKAGKHNCKPPNCSSLARNKAGLASHPASAAATGTAPKCRHIQRQQQRL